MVDLERQGAEMVTQTPDGKILFQFYRPAARQMVIAGDFNGWIPSFQMSRSRDGWWRSRIELAPGTYRFRYKADGEWFTDFAAFGVEPCPGGWNSVLIVEAVAVRAETPVEAPAAKPAVATKAASRPKTSRPVSVGPSIRFITADALDASRSERSASLAEMILPEEPAVQTIASTEPRRLVRQRPALTN